MLIEFRYQNVNKYFAQVISKKICIFGNFKIQNFQFKHILDYQLK